MVLAGDLRKGVTIEYDGKIFTVVENLFSDLSQNDFSLLPFPKSKGNDNATIAWSIFHLFRINYIILKILCIIHSICYSIMFFC